MVGFFIGGAFGTVAKALVWENYKWIVVSALGIILYLLILIVHLVFRKI